jgi:tetratricopeptide (TPR) repeat protein
LAGAYRDAGKIDEAISIYEQVRAAQQQSIGESDPAYWATCNNLGLAYRTNGDVDKALAVLEHAAKLETTARGTDNPVTLATRNQIGATLLAANRVDEAIRELESVRDAQATQMPASDPTALSTLYNLGMAYRVAGRNDDAVVLLQGVHTARSGRYGADHPETLETLNELIVALTNRRSFAEAADRAQELLHHNERKDVDAWQTQDARALLGTALAGQSNFDVAEQLLARACEGLLAHQQSIPKSLRAVRLRRAIQQLINVYEEVGKSPDAAKWREIAASLDGR